MYLSDMLQTFTVGDLVQWFKLCVCFPLPRSICVCSRFACLSFSCLLSSFRQLRFEDPNFEAFSPVPSVQALDAFDTVSNLHSVPVSSGLDAVVYDDTQPSLFTSFISMFVPSLCLSSLTAKGSLSSWIRAGCPSRPRRQKDNARYLWWVVNMTVCFQRLIWSHLNLCKADLSHMTLPWKLKVSALLLVHNNWMWWMYVFLFCQDLGSSDLRKDVYIVVHIIRIGGSYDAASFILLSTACILSL